MKPDYTMSGRTVAGLMRRHGWTIRSLSERMGITMNRIREVRAAGLSSCLVALDWVEAITRQKMPNFDARNLAAVRRWITEQEDTDDA